MNFGHLRNKLSKDLLKKKIDNENFERVVLSFYRYVEIKEDLFEFRNKLYIEWESLGVLGRIYIAKEGINAQLSVPKHNLDGFIANLDNRIEFQNMPLKIAVEHDKYAFLKLTIKIKKQIVADDLPFGTYDVSDVGNHLTPEQFNQALEDPNTIVVDMRNQYESRIGKFENAITPDSDTFREELKTTTELLKDKKDKKVLLYCTGGIRCEKASSYLKHHGFEDVNQLYGGIINYFHEIKEKNIPSKFIGKNFVFDGRLAEKITDDVLTTCDQCGESCDHYNNCHNTACNLLFIQCDVCADKYENCCSSECIKISKMGKEERKLYAEKLGKTQSERYRKRVRPKEKLSCCS